MRILNFTHPLTPAQLAQISALASEQVGSADVLTLPVNLNLAEPLAGQIAAIVERLSLTAEELQSSPPVVNLPGLAPAAAVLLAELHGRMGHFPRILLLARPQGAPDFHVVEIIDLTAVRDLARQRRF